MTTRAIGYVRVSTDDQVREDVSLDVQEARIRAYCEAKGWQLISVVRDEGKSAKDLSVRACRRSSGPSRSASVASMSWWW